MTDWLTEKQLNLVRKYSLILCVDLLPCDQRGLFLKQREDIPDIGSWAIIGGRIMKNEKIDSAIKRHFETETGLSILKNKFLGYYEYAKHDDCRQRVISLIFWVLPSKKEPKYGKFFKTIPITTQYPAKRVIKKFKEVLPCKLHLVI